MKVVSKFPRNYFENQKKEVITNRMFGDTSSHNLTKIIEVTRVRQEKVELGDFLRNP